MTRTLIYCVIWPLIIFPGIFGNILSLIVIRKTEGSNNTSTFLISLAVADTMNLIVKGAQMVSTWGKIFWPHQYITWKMSTQSFSVLSILPDRVSKGITVAIICERVIALKAPFRYKIICRQMRINAIIVLVCVVTASTSLHTIVDIFMFHSAIGENRTIDTNIGKDYGASVSQSTSIYNLVNLLIFELMPILIVFVCNIIIIYSLRKRNILGSTTSEVQRQKKYQERQLTKLLLTISMLFFFLTGPLLVYRAFFVGGVTPSDTIVVLVEGLLMAQSLTNSAINFVVYIVMSNKYRKGYEAIICRCRRANGVEDPREIKHVVKWHH